MYFKRLELRNCGPISNLDLDFQLNANGSPKPVILVGSNGSGKSIAISYLVNTFITMHSDVYENSDVEKGKVYKLRSTQYIKNGERYSRGLVRFANDVESHELQLNTRKKNFSDAPDDYPFWEKMDSNKASTYSTNFVEKNADIQKLVRETTFLYFPPNRFEEPAWLNEQNLTEKIEHTSITRLSTVSERPVIQYSPMRGLQRWLLDLIYEVNVVEQIEGAPKIASKITNAIAEFLRVLYDIDGKLLWSIGERNNRQIGFHIGEEVSVENLFSLSSGQSVMLGLFLTIIKDFDLSDSALLNLSSIKGTVIIDEIDLYLHTDLQNELLPRVLKMFPNVQFIVTTHSPMFLLGMQRTYGNKGFQLMELPTGREIQVERFSEFEIAYQKMTETKKYLEDVAINVEGAAKPLVYLEGSIDIDYLVKAAELLDEGALLAKLKLHDGDGERNMRKIWNAYNRATSSTLSQKVMLLYDCDVKGLSNQQNGKLFRRVIEQTDGPIKIGVENLFPEATIKKAMAYKPAFVDSSPEYKKTLRGENVVVPEVLEVNKDEKRNLCTWICENGDETDFANFRNVFDAIRTVLDAD